MRSNARARTGLSVVAAALIAVVLFSVPAIGGAVTVAHAIPTLQPVPTLQPLPAAVVNIYAAGYPKQPDGSTHFTFWVYNSGNLDAQNVNVHLWYIMHSKAFPYTNEVHEHLVLPKLKAGTSQEVYIQCNASAPLYCSSAIGQIDPGSGYTVGKDSIASKTIPQ
jgi:hypothetical protein